MNENGKIYCIKSKNCDSVYVGSTYKTLARRLREHENYYNGRNNGKKYPLCYSQEIIKHGDYEIYELEKYPCSSRRDLRKREGYYQLMMNCVNKNIAGRTRNEYMKENKEKYREYMKEYYKENKEKHREYMKEYYKKHKELMTMRIECECGGHYTKSRQSNHEKTKRHKEWRTINFLAS